MKTRIVYGLLSVVLGWSAAAGAAVLSDPRPADERAAPPKLNLTNDHLTPPYTEKRWIGLRKKGLARCPAVAGWQKASLLDLALGQSAQVSEGKQLRRLGLDRFCIYTSQDGKPFPKPLPTGLVRAERDRMALSTASLGEIGDQSWRTLAGHFLAQVGQVRLAPTTAPGVRLVFIDSHPTGEGLPGLPPDGSWHGYSMAHLAHELACAGGEPCPIKFATRLALRYDDYDGVPSERGGRLGLVGELAEAIMGEVAHWQELEPEKKLVLNLSVGWDGELCDADSDEACDLSAKKKSQLELSALSVYAALQYARHHGALVIAAAGNRRGGRPDTRWPVLPAAWELRRPTWVPAWVPFALCRKLVYAVGGVDWQGLPLANSRHGGMPERAAYADHAVAITSSGPEEPTMMYTGTSVATAVASSIAAVIWHLRPELGPAAVMELMERSADRLDSLAEFHARGVRPPVKRLSLCRSVREACPGDCPAFAPVDCQPPNAAADLSFVELGERHDTSFETLSALPASCDSRRRLFMVETGTGSSHSDEDLCPMELLPGVRMSGWTSKQPEADPCPNCTIVPEPPRLRGGSPTGRPGYALLLEIGPEWSSSRINRAVLVIQCEPGSEPLRTLDISGSIPRPSGSTKVILGPIDGRESLVGCTASVDFRVGTDADRHSVQSPVYVDP